MALVVADKVKVRSYSTGTGEFQLETVIPGFQSFSMIGDGNETYYGVEDSAGNWEVGRGTYTTDSTAQYLSRDTVLSSSNNNNPVNFPAGGKTVFCTIPASVLNNIVAGAVSDSFKTISVAGQSNVVADSATDTLTLVAGSNIDITTNATSDTITIDNNLSSISQDVLPSINSDGSTGFTLGSPSFQWKELFVSNGSIYIGNVKLSNIAGKLAVTKVINPGEEDEEDDPEDSDAGSEVRASNKLVKDDHEFVLESDGTLTLDGDPFTGGSGGGVDGLTGIIYESPDSEGDGRYELDINNDIALRTYDAGSGGLGPGISLGFQSGGNLSSGVIAIGNNDTGYKGKKGGVYIGYQAGWNNAEQPQGEYAIAIGAKAARNIALDNSITLNATGVSLDPDQAGLFIKPVRQDTGNTAKAVYYDTTSGELTYADPAGGSSGITIITPEDYEVSGVTTLAFAGAGVAVDRIDDITTVIIEGGGTTSYTPDDTDNWEDPAVNTIAAALDELAARVTALQNFEIDGGNANTPALGELLIDGNGA